MIQIVYQLLCVAVVFICVRNLLRSRDLLQQATYGLVIIPFLLRALLVR